PKNSSASWGRRKQSIPMFRSSIMRRYSSGPPQTTDRRSAGSGGLSLPSKRQVMQRLPILVLLMRYSISRSSDRRETGEIGGGCGSGREILSKSEREGKPPFTRSKRFLP